MTPSGRIDVQRGSPDDGPGLSAKAAGQIIEAFSEGRGEGVLHLGAAELSTDLSPSLSYWRDVGRVFVGRVCGALDPTDPKSLVIPEPDADELSALVQAEELPERKINSAFWYVIVLAVVLTGLVMLAAPWVAAFYGSPELTPMVRGAGQDLASHRDRHSAQHPGADHRRPIQRRAG